MKRRASHLDTSNAITGHSSSSQEVSNRRLGVCGQRMLQDWFQPKRNSGLLEAKVKACLHNLALVPEQQSALDSGIRLDQWTLERSQAAQPFNILKRQLITSISSSRQASTVLMANADYLAGHCHQIENAVADAAPQAFYPVRERNLFTSDPQNTVMDSGGMGGSRLPWTSICSLS